MNRRQFTQGLAALATTPALPAKTLAGAATAAKAAIPLHQYQHPYSWAAFVARIHDKASPEMFARQLSLSDKMAREVYDTLLREKVIGLPDAAGISRAFNPFRQSPEQVLQFQAQTAEQAPQSAHKTPEADQTEPEQQTEPAPEPEDTDDSPVVNQEVAPSDDDTESRENTPNRPAADDTGSDQLA